MSLAFRERNVEKQNSISILLPFSKRCNNKKLHFALVQDHVKKRHLQFFSHLRWSACIRYVCYIVVWFVALTLGKACRNFHRTQGIHQHPATVSQFFWCFRTSTDETVPVAAKAFQAAKPLLGWWEAIVEMSWVGDWEAKNKTPLSCSRKLSEIRPLQVEICEAFDITY